MFASARTTTRPTPAPGVNARVRVNLGALQANYRAIRDRSAAGAAGVVKADGYGLGLEAVTGALAAAGCRTFFTATTGEGSRVRAQCPDATVYVLSGVIPQDTCALLAEDLVPCLYRAADVEPWIAAARAHGRRARVALHLETGIHRLGIGDADARRFAQTLAERDDAQVELVMSHLASADEPDSPMNAMQLERFAALRALFPGARASLCNSAGALLEARYHFDLVRPGIAVYGHDPHYGRVTPRVRPVATFEALIAQIKTVPTGEAVGYGETMRCERPTRVGIVLAGYADGIHRHLSWREDRPPFEVSVAGHAAPVLGRVSMDMTVIGLDAVPQSSCYPGAWAQIFGDAVPLEAAAARAGTIPYELLTSLGLRVARHYE